MSDERYTAQAACKGFPPEYFFPSDLIGEARAKRVCSKCPVQRECLQEALAIGAEGVWGGLSEDERRSLRRQRVR